MTLRERLRGLDERTGAASFGRFASWVGGYWCVLAGIVAIVIGALDMIEGKSEGAGALVMGAVGCFGDAPGRCRSPASSRR